MSAVVDAATGSCDLNNSAKDCAIDCLLPWNWFKVGNKFGVRNNVEVRHSTKKRAKDAARHATGSKPRPTPKKSKRKKRKEYEEQQTYRRPERHPNSKHNRSHYHDSNKSQNTNTNRHHTYPKGK